MGDMRTIRFKLLHPADGIPVCVDGETYLTGYKYTVPQSTALALMRLSVAHLPDNWDVAIAVYNRTHGYE